MFGKLPALMGIVNVTPDSFSDGGQYFSAESAVQHALRLEDEGADILDIGGESTRPYSERVSEEDELRRIVPVLESLMNRVSTPISIDTTRSKVAQAAIELGAEIINDISGLEFDSQMLGVAANTGAAVCAMHIQGTPQNMQNNPCYENVVEEILNYLRQRDAALVGAGIAGEKICLDPGIGFGKTHEHNWQLIQSSKLFLALGRPILVGHSRKGFVRKLAGNPTNPQSATLGVSLALACQGIQVLRVHDVQVTRDALLTFQASGALQ